MHGDTGDTGWIFPGWEDSLEEEMAIHSSILAWKSPGAEEPAELQSPGWQRVGHNWATQHSTWYKHQEKDRDSKRWEYGDAVRLFTKEQSVGSSTDLLRVESLPGIQLQAEQKSERKSIFHHWVFLEFKIIGHRKLCQRASEWHTVCVSEMSKNASLDKAVEKVIQSSQLWKLFLTCLSSDWTQRQKCYVRTTPTEKYRLAWVH